MRGIQIRIEEREGGCRVGGCRVGDVGRNQNRLCLVNQAIVFRVEDGVDGGKTDVFVGPTVAGDVVRIEQLVVVKAWRRRRIRRVDDIVGIGQQRIAEGIEWIGGGGDVDQELVAGA